MVRNIDLTIESEQKSPTAWIYPSISRKSSTTCSPTHQGHTANGRIILRIGAIPTSQRRLARAAQQLIAEYAELTLQQRFPHHEKDLTRIFERFYQAPLSKSAAVGIGLNLAMRNHRSAPRHRLARNLEPDGVEFIVRIPLVSPSSPKKNWQVDASIRHSIPDDKLLEPQPDEVRPRRMTPPRTRTTPADDANDAAEDADDVHHQPETGAEKAPPSVREAEG